jgi:SanA protein
LQIRRLHTKKTIFRAIIYTKWFLKWIAKIFFLAIVGILACNVWVIYSTNSQNYYDIDKLPAKDVGLVLGTSKHVFGKKENLFFKYRMEAAARLYHEGKVKMLLVSGNHDSRYYNEPEDMRKALMALDVPSEVIELDYAGFRTADSINNCRKIFGHQQITIVSQPFHNVRALFLANNLDVEAIAFSAQDVPDGYSVKTLLREYLARPRALLDVWVLEPLKQD